MKATAIRTCIMFAIAFIFASCERTIDLTEKETGVTKQTSNGLSFNGCRLLSWDFNGVFQEFYSYNSKGLMSDYYNNEFGEMLWETTTWYDSKGNQAGGSFSYADGTTYDIVFEYENGRVVKETWYETGTNIVADYMVNTYNNKGQIIRRDDPPYDIYTTFGYDAAGNVLYSDIRLTDGTPDARWEYTYDKPIKNPSKAIPGLNNYAWWYVNDMFSPSKSWSASLFVNDGAGNYVKLFGEDPSKTAIAVGAQNYATNQFTYDDITGDLANEQYWEFENCGGKSQLVNPSKSRSLSGNHQLAKDIALLKMPIAAGGRVKLQLAERKAAIQRLKNRKP